ncbi:MAG TPA: hypothetical protein DEO71_19815 [Chryseobacterium sp.]|nr:hypothetical protein [Chryseobacterium sp.]
MEHLDRGSISLKSEKNEFSDIPNLNIEREEINMFFDWAYHDLDKEKLGTAKFLYSSTER